MRKPMRLAGMIGLSLVFISPLIASPQEGKETSGKAPVQADILADNNQYVIGPEDVLFIHTWKEDALSRTVPVRMDGKISLPLIDEIQAAGLTPLELKTRLTEELKKYLDAPNVSVTVVEANSFKVYVSGQVRSPGVYRLRSETSLLQIIPMAGGLTEWANSKKVVIIRKEKGKERRITINYKKLLKGETASAEAILKAGDTIIIP